MDPRDPFRGLQGQAVSLIVLRLLSFSLLFPLSFSRGGPGEFSQDFTTCKTAAEQVHMLIGESLSSSQTLKGLAKKVKRRQLF